ncbi:MAG: NAD(+) diphosphatase [Bacteroidales bacterium]|nr:NAD(+) diphosphatase [Bacteroidales bacterium]
MIHEIFPYRFNNQFVSAKEIREEDFILYYRENTLLVKKNNEELEIPRKKDFFGYSTSIKNVFLFTLDDVSCFLIWDCPEMDNDQFIFKEINFFRTFKQKEIAWISIVGLQVMNWYLQNRYCGKCGSATKEKPDERAIICPNCNTTVFPKISPAIIVAIINNNKILLAHNANFPESWHSLVAGYVDIGESLEEAVKREVKEEVGLDVKNIRYYKSQPWPFSGSMMIGFFAEADDRQPVCPDNIEITEAAWYTRGNLPNHPPGISIAGEMIDKFEREEI